MAASWSAHFCPPSLYYYLYPKPKKFLFSPHFCLSSNVEKYWELRRRELLFFVQVSKMSENKFRAKSSVLKHFCPELTGSISAHRFPLVDFRDTFVRNWQVQFPSSISAHRGRTMKGQVGLDFVNLLFAKPQVCYLLNWKIAIFEAKFEHDFAKFSSTPFAKCLSTTLLIFEHDFAKFFERDFVLNWGKIIQKKVAIA